MPTARNTSKKPFPYKYEDAWNDIVRGDIVHVDGLEDEPWKFHALVTPPKGDRYVVVSGAGKGKTAWAGQRCVQPERVHLKKVTTSKKKAVVASAVVPEGAITIRAAEAQPGDELLGNRGRLPAGPLTGVKSRPKWTALCVGDAKRWVESDSEIIVRRG